MNLNPLKTVPFLLTRLCEARQNACGAFSPDGDFYSRASARRDSCVTATSPPTTHFYSRASARRDMSNRAAMVLLSTFLLTRLCEARRKRDKPRLGVILISTHAPLRGATIMDAWANDFAEISTHAPLRGATSTSSTAAFSSSNFYSRASARRDPVKVRPNGAN